jgi:predicted transport protein
MSGASVSDLKLFRIIDGHAEELLGGSVALEKSLQRVIGANMTTMFGVRFLATEYSTGVRHGGRIDSLGIDDTGSPVIFEYKRSVNESVINQGLFYLDWLVHHKAEFELLVMRTLGAEVAATLDWSAPRVICVANSFTKYDEHAVQQMGRSIELVRYQDFAGELLSLDLIKTARGAQAAVPEVGSALAKPTASEKTAGDHLESAPQFLKDLFADLGEFIESLGDDVTATERKNYFAYRRIRNFACVEVHPQSGRLLVYLKVNPDSVHVVDGFMRDVRNIGHFGTGDLELRIATPDDLEQALPYVQKSYDNS